LRAVQETIGVSCAAFFMYTAIKFLYAGIRGKYNVVLKVVKPANKNHKFYYYSLEKGDVL